MSRPFVRRHFTTLGLVAAASVGAFALFVVDRGSVTTQEAELRKTNLLPSYKLEDIRSITFTNRGKTAVMKLGPPSPAGQRLWEVTLGGAVHTANQQSIDQLLGTLEYATYERRVSDDAKDENNFGFDKPATTVIVEMGSQTYRVAVGGVAPTPKDGRYCESPAGTFVITAQLAAALDMVPEAFRTRTFVPYLSIDLAKLRVDGEGGNKPFVKASWSGGRGAGFRFEGGTPEGTVRVNAALFDKLLGALGAMLAESFLSDEEAEKALQKRITLTMVPRDSKKPQAVIDIGGVCPGKEEQVVAVRREPTRTSACIPKTVLETLVLPAKDYVDLSVVGAPFDEVTEIAVTRGDKTIEIARKEAAWHMRKPADRKVSPDAGNALATDLTNLDGTALVTGAPKDFGLEPPAATLRITSLVPTFTAENGSIERIETVLVSAPRGEVAYVQRSEDGSILEIPAEKLRTLSPSEAVLRDAEVLQIPKEQVRSLSLSAQTSGAVRTQKLTRGDEGWTFAEPPTAGATPDTALLADLVDAVVNLRAVRWVAEKNDGTFGLEKPRFVIEMTVRENDAAPVQTLRIELGGAATDGMFGVMSRDAAVFVAPPSLTDLLDLWLINRQSLVIEAPLLVRVEAEAKGGKKLVAERSGDVWKTEGGNDAAVATTLRNAVAGLVAEGVVGIGAPDKSFGFDAPRLVMKVVAEPPQGAPKGTARKTTRLTFGAFDSYRGARIVYVRKEGLDVTFAVAQGDLRELFSAAGVP